MSLLEWALVGLYHGVLVVSARYPIDDRRGEGVLP